MPEGDSVYRTAARLREALAGKQLTRSDFRVPRFATADLTGFTTLEVVPRGKHLLIRFGHPTPNTDPGIGPGPEAELEAGPGPGPGPEARPGPALLTLHTHLRMDGAWRILPTPGTSTPPHPPGPAHEIRVILATADHTAVGYRLPVVELLRTADEHRAVGHLGPDLLGPDWNAELAAANLLAAPARPLGEALLDQRNLAGIGNIYKAELCFLAQVTPWTPVGDLPPRNLPRLAAAAHRLLDANKARHRNTTGSRRHGQDLFVYGRAHRPCLRCGTPVREAPQDDRPTYWCPRCQSGPTP
ncbi:Fpg/Nei family DNA glycosylase [Streptomyces sp. NBC_01264]|uniref:Fpg/Nei family DNA glycosylase n=1 Tax=Streptomyces sp. NBC_01264 TaxID=2903804 RepID=UPI00225950B1|nr:DNA-formamidopyrimidine glycosylase family protein [Streptomyces sp. NBC_01264]MCX4781431.1 DNA glycosylase [Streptomyces sp. NBC_01264]